MFISTTKKIVYISLLTALLFAVKLAFGWIAGVEFVTALILMYAVFLPFYWSVMITIAFNILVGLHYGFGSWWIVYWPMWLTEITLTYLLRHLVGKNNIIFGFWALFWGFSVLFWYATSDYLVGGKALVIVDFISGAPFNAIEGLCNFLFGIILFYPIRSIIYRHINNPQLANIVTITEIKGEK